MNIRVVWQAATWWAVTPRVEKRHTFSLYQQNFLQQKLSARFRFNNILAQYPTKIKRSTFPKFQFEEEEKKKPKQYILIPAGD